MGRIFVLAFAIAAILVLPSAGLAQEATIGGTVVDSTGGVLPGVAVRAVHEATGNQFETFTDQRGAFRIPVRIGTYRIVAELAGFATLTRTGLQALVGQQVQLNLELSPSTVAETVTVTADAPLVNVTSSQLGGNIDSRQLSELPVNGRNFLDLTLLAPGSRANHTSPGGPPTTTGLGTFQLNVDGMQVTNNCCGGDNRQPSFSRDAIAEFQFVSNRFDATQGRSSGVQVNVVTKSGTNSQSGTFSGYFRHDSMNSEDFIQNRVLPYSNQQLSGTFGGPFRRDRAHYFFTYEFEREPGTVTHNSPYPSFNFDLKTVRKQHKANMRNDFQLSNAVRFSITGNLWRDRPPIDRETTAVGGASNHPSTQVKFNKDAEALMGTFTQVLSNSALNEVKIGWAANRWLIEPNLNWTSTTGLGSARNPVADNPPRIEVQGYAIGPAANFPQHIGQDVYSLRDDFRFSANIGGRHDFRLGGEYLKYMTWHDWCNRLNGILRADRGPAPANLEQLFPVWNDPNTWNIAALSPVSRDYSAAFGNCIIHSPRNIFAAWLQDDWAVSSRLTLNLGVRYDVETDTFANELAVQPFLEADRPLDTNNVAPRLGFALTLNDRTVVRGGGGIYYAWLINQVAHPVRFANVQRVMTVLYDGRADFAVNPWNGPLPRLEDLEQGFCNVRDVPGCKRRALGQTIVPPDALNPYSYQGSIGLQRQIGNAMSVSADYSYNGSRRDRITGYNINLSFNPATGRNNPFSNVSLRPYPQWLQVPMDNFNGRSNYHGLEMAFTKRMSNRWQGAATYTFSGFWDGTPQPWQGVMNPVPFTVLEPLGPDYSLAATDQRHRMVFNGIWEAGYGIQLSGLYFFGAGQRFATSYGGDIWNTGGTTGSARVRPDNSATPREGIVGDAIHRVDMRLLRRFRLFGRSTVDGMLEVFNVLNHENYGSYTTVESNRNFSRPSFNSNVAYQPRMLQIGFRLGF